MTQETEAESIITDEMRANVGKESAPQTLEVTTTAIRMFARAVGHTDQIYYDDAYAKSKGHRSIVAPPAFFGTGIYNPAHGGGAGGANQTLPNGRVLRGLDGGREFQYTGVEICAGDVLTAVSKTVDLSERKSSLGMMMITRRETTYTNQNGEVVARAYGTSLQY